MPLSSLSLNLFSSGDNKMVNTRDISAEGDVPIFGDISAEGDVTININKYVPLAENKEQCEEVDKPKKEAERQDGEKIDDKRKIAVMAYIRGDIETAEKAIDQILKVCPNDMFALDRKAQIYLDQGKFERAEVTCLHMLEMAEKEGDEVGIFRILSNLGAIYAKWQKTEKAIDTYEKSLKIYKRYGCPYDMTHVLVGIGSFFLDLGWLGEAECIYQDCFDTYKENDNKEGMVVICVNLGILYYKRGDRVKAKEYWTKAHDLYAELGMPHMVKDVKGRLDWLEKESNNAKH